MARLFASVVGPKECARASTQVLCLSPETILPKVISISVSASLNKLGKELNSRSWARSTLDVCNDAGNHILNP